MTTTVVRERYRKDHQKCQFCHRYSTVQIHEIASAAARQAAMGDRAALLALCTQCHDAFHDYSVWPISRQLALKLLESPEDWDVVAVSRLRGRDDRAIDFTDIVSHLRMRY
jgi:hypothetical protein